MTVRRRQLTCRAPVFTPPPETLTYIWRSGRTRLGSSTRPTLTAPASWHGRRVRFQVKGAALGFATGTVTSAEVTAP